MPIFATYFDRNYLSRGIVLYDSLKEQCKDFELYILCLDEYTESYFKENSVSYPEIKTLALAELEASDHELKTCKSNRNSIEYYFTLSPCLPLYLLRNYNLPHICSLDTDILFLGNPKLLFDDLDEYSIIITPHKFSLELKHLEKFGIYNVSFQIFKNDETAIVCLEKWRSQCIEWCRDAIDEQNERYADQKYLDKWLTLYPGKVKVLNDNVSGLAPWNLNNYRIKKIKNFYYSQDQRIIFYHFHHFKMFSKRWASNGLGGYKVNDNPFIDQLYLEYWNKIEEINNTLGTERDILQRANIATNSNLLLKLANEGSVYFKISKKKLRHINLQYLPAIVKKIIFKLYA